MPSPYWQAVYLRNHGVPFSGVDKDAYYPPVWDVRFTPVLAMDLRQMETIAYGESECNEPDFVSFLYEADSESTESATSPESMESDEFDSSIFEPVLKCQKGKKQKKNGRAQPTRILVQARVQLSGKRRRDLAQPTQPTQKNQKNQKESDGWTIVLPKKNGKNAKNGNGKNGNTKRS